MTDGGEVAHLTVVSPFRDWAASYRTRVDAWLSRTGVPHRVLGPPRGQRPRGTRKLTVGDLGHEVAVRLGSRRVTGRLLVQREASRLGNGAVEQRLIAAADSSVFDLDDAIHLDRGAEGPDWLGSRSDRTRHTIARVDRVIAGNDHLAEQVAGWCDDVVVIPTCIEATVPAADRTQRGVDAPLVIGWLGSASTEPYLAPLYELLGRVQRDLGIVVRIVGATGPSIEQVDGCVVERRPWTLATEADELLGFDIGLAPLADTPWERGKCGYKALQYGMSGLVCVGDDVGVSGEVLRAGQNPTPSTPEQWEEALRTLAADRALRLRLGDRARTHVMGHFTYDLWQDRWLDAATR